MYLPSYLLVNLLKISAKAELISINIQFQIQNHRYFLMFVDFPDQTRGVLLEG